MSINRSYGSIKIDGRSIILNAEPHVLIKLKNVFQYIPKHKVEDIPIPLNDETCMDICWFAERYPLSMDDSVRALIERNKENFISSVNKVEEILKPDYRPSKLSFEGTLRDYQALTIDVLRIKKRLLVGDKVGVGKTHQGMAVASIKEALPLLIVVPVGLVDQWTNKMKEFYGKKVKVHYIGKTKPRPLPAADVYLTKYTCLSGWVDVFINVGINSVVFDEAQELRINTSQKYLAAKTIADNCEYVMPMTATPVMNYGIEAYNIFNLVKTGCLNSMEDFVREWCSDIRTVHSPKALGSYLKENHLIIRRSPEDIGREVPPVSRIVHYVDSDAKEFEKIEDLIKKLAMSSLYGSPMEIRDSRGELDLRLRQATGIAKAKACAAYARILLENDEPVIMTGWHRGFYDIVLKELEEYNPLMITGTESPKKKDDNKKAFINGESKIVLLSHKSGVGLDGFQSVCRYILHGELAWNNKIHEQLTGRIARDGQERHVYEIYLVTNDGSDPVIMDIIGLKDGQSSGITDPDSIIEEVKYDESRLKILAQNIIKNGIYRKSKK